MAGVTDGLGELRREVSELRGTYNLKPDEAFVMWFLRAATVGTEDGIEEGDARCRDALTGGKNDKNMDAVYIDDNAEKVFIIQGKYRGTPQKRAESRSELIAFANLSDDFTGPPSRFKALVAGADPSVQRLLKDAYGRIERRNFQLELQFVTTGTVSPAVRTDAEKAIRGKTALTIIDRRELTVLASDYLEGAAPPVAVLDLPVQGDELFNRYDPSAKVSSWVFSMDGHALAQLHERVGPRLFAPNVRVFLGPKTEVNRAMDQTIQTQPARFWYFNNGVTIVCDTAQQVTAQGKGYLRVRNAQIINGQQTTRVLTSLKRTGRANVLVKLLEVPRDQQYGTLVSALVQATNFQNAISPADLRSNDEVQIKLERELRKIGCIYLRKKQAKSEARSGKGRRRFTFINKEEMARAIGGCILEPEIWRAGKKHLWESPTYDEIFSGRTADECLTFFWLDRLVRRIQELTPAVDELRTKTGATLELGAMERALDRLRWRLAAIARHAPTNNLDTAA